MRVSAGNELSFIHVREATWLQRAAADVISVDPLSAILSPRSQPKIGIPALIRLRSGAHAPHELCVFEIFAPGSHQTVGQRRLKDSSYDKFGRPRRTGGNEWTLSHRFFLFVYVATGLGYPRKEKGSSNVPKHLRQALGGPLAYRLVD
jgi:hypothetical protein